MLRFCNRVCGRLRRGQVLPYQRPGTWGGAGGMSGWLGQMLPTLGSLGVWTYWVVGAAAMLEAFFVTGIVVPGTLIVDAGGALVRLGTLDFFDLVWFVAAGTAIGGELSYWTGRRAGPRLTPRWDPSGSTTYRRAADLLRRRGGMALVIGRFLGPVSGLAAFAAALAGMERRRFRVWNLVGAVAYAFVHVSIGYAAGDVFGRIGPLLTRLALFAAALAAVLGLIWLIARQIRRGLPVLLAGLAALLDMALAAPPVARLVSAHPRAAAFVAARFATDRFTGLTATALAAVFLYLGIVWADTALDFVYVPQVAETDLRLARLLHAFWSPAALRGFGLITELGHATVVLAVLVGAGTALLILRRFASLAQLLVALGGELMTVRLLKGAFARPRPDLSYFVETSGSFPSGHATLSVAFWGTLCVILWREKVLGPTVALVSGAVLAFLIGFSRLYLVEHFLSDVVNGWLLGGLWLVIGLAVAEALRERGWNGAIGRRGPALAAAVILAVTAGVAGWQVLSAGPPRAAALVAPAPAQIDPAAALGSGALPLVAETLAGERALPVSLIVVAQNLPAVEARLAAAGWTAVDRPGVTALARAAWADWTGHPDPAAPLLPLFWRGSPQDAGWHSPDGASELRLWRAGATTADGSAIIAAVPAPSAEEGPSWAVGAASETLVAALGPDILVRIETTGATTGAAPGGRTWTWDGQVVVATLGPQG